MRLNLRVKASWLNKVQDPVFWQRFKDRVMNEVALEMPGYIQNYIRTSRAFNPRSGAATARWKSQVVGNSVVVKSLMPYYYYLNYGVRAHQMTYLMKAKKRTYLAFGKYPYIGRAFIPVNPAAGVFRRATAKAMGEGKWRHPGRRPTLFFEGAIQEYTQVLKNRYKQLLIEELRG